MNPSSSADGAAFKDSLRKAILDSTKANQVLRHKADGLLKESEDFKKQADDLLKQAGRKMEASKAASQSAIKVKQSVAPTIDLYGQLTCRGLCDDMFNKFPLELRQMVYRYFTTRDSVIIEPFNNIRFDDHPTYWDLQFEAKAESKVATHWDVTYVGKNTLIELVENYYRTSTFRILSTNHHAPSVSRFLTTDQWGVGFVPASVVTRLEVHLIVEKKVNDDVSFPAGLATLQGLSALNHKAQICITCSPMNNFDIINWSRALELLYPLVVSLKNLHHDITVEFRNFSFGYIRSMSRASEPGPLLFSSTYKGFALENWLETLDKELLAMSPQGSI